ncbi:MAG: hypothetical protein K9N23_17910 [Akkermansiaceae bacterium]|nr:hypothetical protein [Akkermansiaceae bacterium]MCF7733570.1 hypothetical protein [Akkermansiaceae bacterium]
MRGLEKISVKKTSDCKFYILAGHGWFPEGENDTPSLDKKKPNAHRGDPNKNEKLLSYLRSMKPGDRVSHVSCFGGDINDWLNKHHPDKAIPDSGGHRHDPHTPLWVPDGTDLNKDPDWNKDQQGFLRVDQAIHVLESEVWTAMDQAEDECNNKDSCCKSVTIVVNCMDGGRPDFGVIARKTEEGKRLCNKEQKYDCSTKTWTTTNKIKQ